MGDASKSGSRLAVVMNKHSGKKDAAAQEQLIRSKLEPHFADVALHPVARGGQIEATARRAAKSADIVVALGGDGTQSAIAGALAGSDTIMGVLPGGTFNYFARELGVGETVDAALDTLVTGQVSRIDLAEVNGRVFLNNASFGVYPEILRRREAIYDRWGRSRMAAYWSVFLTLRDLRDPMHLTLTADGVTRDFYTPLAFAARSAFQLERLGLDGADAIREGQFALFLAKHHQPRQLLGAAMRLALGKAAHGEDFDLVIADDILIEGQKSRRLVAFDGEKGTLKGPFRLKVLRDALRIIIPAAAEPEETVEARAAG